MTQPGGSREGRMGHRWSVGAYNKCPVCQEKEEQGESICDSCRTKARPDPVGRIDSFYLLTILAMVIGLLIIYPGSWYLNIIGEENRGYGDMAIMLIGLAAMSSVIPPFQNRSLLMRKEPLRDCALLLGAVLTVGGLGALTFLGRSGLYIIPATVGILSGGSLLFLSRRGIMSYKWHRQVILLIGILLSNWGFHSTAAHFDPFSSYWLLSGPILMLAGLVMAFISTYSLTRDMPLNSRSSVPILLWSTGMLMVCISLLLIGIDSGLAGGFLDILLFQGSLTVIIAAGAMLRKRKVNWEIQNNLRSMRDSLSRAAVLERGGDHIYALQQLDRSLELNPISGLGMIRGSANIVFRVEGDPEIISYNPGEYELAYVEKAKIMASQNNFPGAISAYGEAIKRNPNFLDSYRNLAMLLSSMPGKGKEADRHLDYLWTSKGMYLKRWVDRGMTREQLEWLIESIDHYEEAIGLKRELLARLGSGGDILGYYSLLRS